MSGSFRLVPEFVQQLDAAIEKGLTRLANDIVKSAQASMREPKSGIDYRNKSRKGGKSRSPTAGHKGARNISSAPGEAPAVQYNDLIESVNYEVSGKYMRRVGTNQKHGRYMELGTKHIKPRPWLRPALKKHTGRDAEVCFEGKLR